MNPELELGNDPKIRRRLKFAMEAAKCRLSNEPFAVVREEYLDGRRHLELEILRSDYEQMIGHLLEKTVSCLHQALSDAGITPREISKAMLVGGATRTPLIAQLLRERLKQEPRFEIDPDLIVSMGAAIQVGILAGEQRHAILVDITPHTLSTAAMSDDGDWPHLICVPIIHRNTPLPAGKSEMFYTMYDGQEQVEVTAYQGEGRLPEENALVGKFMIEGLADVPAGNALVLHFDLDLNGRLQVTTTEKATGLSRSVTMDTRAGNVVDIEEARRNVASLVGEEIRSEAAGEDPESLLAGAKDVRKRAEALAAANVNQEDAAEIRRLLHESSRAIAEQKWEELARLNDSLADLLFYLED